MLENHTEAWLSYILHVCEIAKENILAVICCGIKSIACGAVYSNRSAMQRYHKHGLRNGWLCINESDGARVSW
jgi:hypothetical protein